MQDKFFQKSRNLKVKGISLVTIAIIFIIWFTVSNLDRVDPFFIPKPQAVWSAFIILITEGYKGIPLLTHFSSSMYRLFTALLFAFITAVPLGLLCGNSKVIRSIFDPIIEFYRPLPPLAYYALLVLWLGIG
ncbi:MAG: hypothetical protein ACXVNF_05340 [Neobacillus sp.]